jgi:hypothetical protein
MILSLKIQNPVQQDSLSHFALVGTSAVSQSMKISSRYKARCNQLSIGM